MRNLLVSITKHLSSHMRKDAREKRKTARKTEAQKPL
jgi:hypothetical protein